VIRPLILAEERQIADVAALLDIPAASCACPAGDASQRRRMKALLASFGREATAIKRRLQRLATGRGERG
jgi:tRNA(Ile)-lysidine synthase TilS/MesJ